MSSPHILVFSEEATVYQELVQILPAEIEAVHFSALAALRDALPASAAPLVLLHLSAVDGVKALASLDEWAADALLVVIAPEALTVPQFNALLEYNVQALIAYPFQTEQVRVTLARALERVQRQASQRYLKENLTRVSRQLNQRLQEINTIYTVGKSVTSSLDVEEVLARIVEASVNLTQAEEGFILLTEDGKLYLRVSKNMNTELAQRLCVEASDPIAWQVIHSGRPTMLQRSTKIATGYLVRALLYVPIQSPGRGTVGVLSVVNQDREQAFTENQLFTLSAIADFAAIALENAQLFTAVEAERSRLSAILEHAAEAILVTDMDNCLWLWSDSAAENFNIKPDARGQKVVDYINNIGVRELFVRLNDDQALVHNEVDLEDGRVFNAQLSSIDHIGRVVVMQDITHLKELDRLKSEFVFTVSHDLRTPLTTIQGYIELLERVGPLNEGQQDFIAKALYSLSHITTLISDLLDIGRIEAGYDLEMHPFRINDVIRQSVDTHTMLIEQAELHAETDIPDEPLWIHGNPRRIRQVLDNLINNAIKYSRPGGMVKVIAQPGDDYVIVSVEDQGIGIPLEEQPKLFKRFYRVRSPETEDIHGTGLGLSIVKSVIEKHKGLVWVRSYPGKGSTFAFILTLCPTPSEDADV
jgi:two-component system phosphate regulon sensor histidine kinase PhoR